MTRTLRLRAAWRGRRRAGGLSCPSASLRLGRSQGRVSVVRAHHLGPEHWPRLGVPGGSPPELGLDSETVARWPALSDCTGRMERYRAPVPDSRWPERVCVCVLACGCVLACLLRLACLHACVRACACVCDTVCARARVRMCARLCVSVYVRACVCVRASACVRACARMCAGHARARARDGLCGGFEGDCCRCCCSICAYTCLRDSDYQLHMNPGQTPHPYLHTSYTRLTHESR